MARRETISNLRKMLVFHLNQNNVLIKPISTTMIKTLRHGEGNINNLCSSISATGQDDPINQSVMRGNPTERSTFLYNNDTTQGIFSSIYNSELCGENVRQQHKRMWMCGNAVTDVEGAAMFDRNSGELIGYAFWNKWNHYYDDETELRYRKATWIPDYYEEVRPRNAYTSQSARKQYVNWLYTNRDKLANLEIICTQPQKGKLLYAYVLHKLYSQRSKGDYKYNGIILNMGKPKENNKTYDRWGFNNTRITLVGANSEDVALDPGSDAYQELYRYFKFPTNNNEMINFYKTRLLNWNSNLKKDIFRLCRESKPLCFGTASTIPSMDMDTML